MRHFFSKDLGIPQKNSFSEPKNPVFFRQKPKSRQFLSFIWDEEEGLLVRQGSFPHDISDDSLNIHEAGTSLLWFPFRHALLHSFELYKRYSYTLDKEVISKVDIQFNTGTVFIVMAEEAEPTLLPSLSQLTFDGLGWLYIVFEKEILDRFDR
ncbi:MAG: hypothetical protein AAF587_10275 [Bacteroidota bacterium]